MNLETAETTSAHQSPKLRLRKVLPAITAGNLLEWYDFAIYSAMASVISPLFFPQADPVAGLLATFAVFAIGYVARPVGAAIFGRLADRHGRKKTLVALITLMGVATIGIGLLPTYETIGVLAPVLLVLARLAQGLSLGGEFSSATSFLLEIAPKNRRGLITSISLQTSVLGFAIGVSVAYSMNLIFTSAQVSDWVWRVPFLLSFPILLIGASLRRRTEESPAFLRLHSKGQIEKSPLLYSIKHHWRSMLRIIGIGMVWSVGTYMVMAFALSFVLVILKVPANIAYPSVILAMICGVAMMSFWAMASDRYGRRPVLLVGIALHLAVAVPAFLLMTQETFAGVFLGQLLLWIPASLFSAVQPVTLTELFPSKVRVTALGVPYAVASALFAGTSPFVSTLLVETTGEVISPAFYLLLAGLVSLPFILTLKETAFSDME